MRRCSAVVSDLIGRCPTISTVLFSSSRSLPLCKGLAAGAGDLLRKHAQPFKQGERPAFNTVQAATFTLLALIIGFTSSVAVSRYDQRKALEEPEANAIGTQYLRAALLPGDNGAHTRELLRQYLDQRIAFYEAGDAVTAAQIEKQTATLQSELWAAVMTAAAASRPRRPRLRYPA